MEGGSILLLLLLLILALLEFSLMLFISVLPFRFGVVVCSIFSPCCCSSSMATFRLLPIATNLVLLLCSCRVELLFSCVISLSMLFCSLSCGIFELVAAASEGAPDDVT